MREVCATCPDYDLANVTATLRNGSSLLASAATTGVKLHHVPAHEPLVREGMRAEFRKAPAFEGETVYVDIYANTGDQQLAIWEIAFSYDASLLTLKSGTQSAYFQPPIVNHDGAAGSYRAVTLGNTDAGSAGCPGIGCVRQGTSVPIMTITMKVKSGVLPGCASSPVVFDGGGKGVVSLLVVGMVTPNSMQFVTREAARIDGFVSATGDALFQTTATTTGTSTAAASVGTASWHQQTYTDLGALWDSNRVRLQSLG